MHKESRSMILEALQLFSPKSIKEELLMLNHETVRPATPDQRKEVLASVIQQVILQFPDDLSFVRAQQLIGRKKQVGEGIARILRGGENPVEVITEWQDFYKQLGIEVDLSGVVVPDYQDGFSRVLVIPQGLTLNRVWAVCRERFASKCWSWCGDDLDVNVPTNDRVSTASYAIRVRDRVEADEELKNLSANDLKKKKIAGITLLERLIYELKYFSETGKHLDLVNWTLCTGSRDSGGHVPYVDWRSDDKLRVYWYGPGNSDDDLRARAVVSA